MRVAICDDELKDLQELQTAIKRYGCAENLEVYAYTRAAELYAAEERFHFDIAILDIEMEAPNGYEIAKRLVEHRPGPIIMFLTNSMAYTIRGYGVAFRYLTKPIDPQQLNQALSAAICEVNANRFVFSVDGTAHIVRIDDIYYFEVFNHYIVLHITNQEYTFRAALRDVLSKLPGGYFGMPHQSYIVNFSHVKAAMPKEVHLTNGAVIPMSRRKQEDFNCQLHRYLGR